MVFRASSRLGQVVVSGQVVGELLSSFAQNDHPVNSGHLALLQQDSLTFKYLERANKAKLKYALFSSITALQSATGERAGSIQGLRKVEMKTEASTLSVACHHLSGK